MHDIEFADLVMKCPAQRRCPIKSSDQGTREISDLNAIKIYRCCDGVELMPAPSILVVKTCTSCPLAASARQRPWTAKIGPPWRTAGK
jgi:hypothetical protein